VRNEFERCWPWLAAALEHAGGTHGKEDLWKTIENCSAQLHPLRNGAIVTTIQTHPSGLKDANAWLAGGNLGEIVEVIPLLETWLQSEGCKRVTLTGRKGWMKALPTYKHTGIIMVKDLTHG
jgi:hypothetical protein